MKNLKKITTENLSSIKSGMMRAVNNAILEDHEKQIITKKIDQISIEIARRLQLTLDFNEEPDLWDITTAICFLDDDMDDMLPYFTRNFKLA